MRTTLPLAALLILLCSVGEALSAADAAAANAVQENRMLAIAIHGGAGVIARSELGADNGARYRQ